MMRKRSLLIGVLLMGGFFLFCFGSKVLNGIKLPVQFSHDYLEPIVSVAINGKNRSVFVDLGCAVCDFHFDQRVLEEVGGKERLADGEMGDLKGNVYPMSRFRIPEIYIGGVPFLNAIVAERNHEYMYYAYAHPGSSTWKQISDASKRIDGKMGLPLFQKYNCLFDFPNSVIALQNQIEEGEYPPDRFVSVPFSVEKYGVVLSVQTDGGVYRMVLDTGATHSVIRKRGSSNQGKWYDSTNQLVMGGCNYGPWDFVLFDVSEKWNIDGCIGVDFFLEHAIFLDFANHIAYIERPERFFLLTQWKRFKFRATQFYRKMVSGVPLLAQGAESTEVTVEITWDFVRAT